MNKQAFLQGFMEKCAENNLTLKQSQELFKQAIKTYPQEDVKK